MKIVFDQGVPVPLRSRLTGYEVVTVYELGWSLHRNGELIREAEAAGFHVFVTTDQNLKYQQDLGGRQISIIVLQSTSWPRIQRQVEAIRAAVACAAPGSYQEVPIA